MNIIKSHLPNGPNAQNPEKIIVHSMGEYIDNGKGDIYHAVDWLVFIGLSVHALIAPTGDIFRCREDNEGAWHARGHNVNSLGVEFLVPGVHNYSTFLETIKTDWVTPEQYKIGTTLIKSWIDKYHINSIDRHSDVSPGRKVDPGAGFKWQEFLEGIGHE